MKIGIINYGLGNINSVKNSIEYLGYSTTIIEKPEQFEYIDKFILPGVGSYKKGMANLRELDFISKIYNEVSKGKPILGICLGMQLLSKIGFENGISNGLNFFHNDVDIIKSNLKLPHIGWNNIEKQKNSKLYTNIKDYNFYFLHSYSYKNIDQYTTAYCEYGIPIVASLEKDNIYGVQFHPEKSQKSGLQLLRNFIELC
jgi:glutamine amidotransferase